MDSESEGDYSEDFEGSSHESYPALSPPERTSANENPQNQPKDAFANLDEDFDSSPQLLSYGNGQRNGTLNEREEKIIIKKKVDSLQEVATSKGSIPTSTARTNHEGSPHLKPTARDTTQRPPKGVTKVVSLTPAKNTPAKYPSKGTSKGISSRGGALLKVSPRDREMSARNNRIKSLSSRVTYLQKQLEEVQKENKLLKRIQVRQEKELQNLHGNEGELPKMIHRHNEEVRFYTERLKQMREANDLLNRKLHSSEESASILLEKNSKLKGIAEKKKLLERDKLTRKLDITMEDLKKAGDHAKDLQHTNQMLIKKHAAEYRFLEKKKKALSDQVEELTEANESFLKRLKERERELEVLNIYAQKVGRNFPKVQSSALSSKDTQTEVSLSSSKELFSIPPSLSHCSTQTACLKLKSSSTQTEVAAPKKSDTVFVSAHDSTRPGSAVGSLTQHSYEQSRESLQEPAQEHSPSSYQKPLAEDEVKEKVYQTEQLSAQPVEHAVTSVAGIPKFSALALTKTQASDKTQQNQVLPSTSSGTAQLKNEEDLKKKMLLSKLLNMDAGSQAIPPVSEPAKDVSSATPAPPIDMYVHKSQPTVPANVTSKPTTTAHFSRQPGTVLSVLTSTTPAPPVSGPSKPWTNIPHVGTTTSTAAPFATTKPFQHSNMTPSVPFSATQSIPPQVATQASTATILHMQPTPVPTATTTEPKPNGLTGYNKGSSFAFGSTFTTQSAKHSTPLPVQNQSTTLQSPLTMAGAASQQNGTAKLGMARNPTRKIDDDKKKELLAKLTAMENLDGLQEKRLRTGSKSSSGQSSSSHLWPNTVENLHQGKHAYATENDPYGSRVLDSDSRRGPNTLSTGHSEKLNSSFVSGRQFKVESKPNLLEGASVKRNTTEYSWENKVNLQGVSKGGGGIFADIMGQTSFNSIQAGQSRTRVLGNGKPNVNSVIQPGQLRTSNTSSLS